MLSMRLEQVLPAIRDMVLPVSHDVKFLENGLREEKALAFSLDISMSSPNNYENRKRFGLHIMFFGNTSVFYILTKSPFDKPDWTKAINATNHNSCWRSMEFLSSIFFNNCKEIDDEARPCDIDQSIYFSLLRDAWKIGTVQWKKDETDKSNYKRKIVSFDINK